MNEFIRVKIPSRLRGQLIEDTKKQIQELQEFLYELESQSEVVAPSSKEDYAVNDTHVTIAETKQAPKTSSSAEDSVLPSGYTWKRIAIEILENANKFIPTSEAADIAISQYNIDKSRDFVVRGLSSILGSSRKKEYVRAIKNTFTNEIYWGLPKYFDRDTIKYEFANKLKDQSGFVLLDKFGKPKGSIVVKI